MRGRCFPGLLARERALPDGNKEQWTCPGFVDTWVKLPMLLVRAAARTLGD